MPRKGQRREKTPCPQCNTPKKFAPQRRGDDDHYEVFIRCGACGWENVLRSGPRRLVELEMDVEHLRQGFR
jgi:RNase P subunit RPR2